MRSKMGKQKTAFIRAHPSARCAKKANLSDSEAIIRQPNRRPLMPPPPAIPLLSTIHSNHTSQATSLNYSNNGQRQPPQQQQQQHHHQPLPTSQTRLPRPVLRVDNMYESISSRQSGHPHIYEVIDSKPKVPPRSSRTKSRPVEIMKQLPLPPPPPLPPTAPPVPVENFNTPHVLQPNVLKYFQQKLYESFGNDPQPQRTLLETVCTPATGASGDVFNGKNRIDLMLETAQFLATAAYLERAAQKVASSSSGSRRMDTNAGGFCGALQRAPPPVPPALSRRLANRENLGFGKVKVMLRVSDSPPEDPNVLNYMVIDKKKRQVTLSDPTNGVSTTNGALERGPMVSAPKIFAFDSLFTADDAQVDVCTSGLSEVIPAVLEGSDGCLLSLGYPGAGQTKTMMGSLNTNELGAIPCAIAWLYKGINEKRQKTGARFSVRVSALGVNATKPGTTARDLLAAHATESDESPGVYLRDDFLGGPTELRAPTAERAALFLDAALVARGQGPYDPALIFTLHVYQYSLAGKGGVAGGRSRLHLIDLGGCSNRSGGLPLSAIGNTLLSILSGQRHPPNRDHPLTPLLKDCLAPLTCHVAIIAHVAHSQTHTDALTTIQLASRIHRMRRRKHRFPMSSDKNLGLSNSSGHQSGGSSEGPDPSSSDLSADTVIYVGPCEETDGEHPPVYLPSLSSGDNRCVMSKALRGSGLEAKPSPKKTVPKPQPPVAVASSPKRQVPKVKPQDPQPSPRKFASAVSKASNIPTPKGSPMKRPLPQEQWIDGPRVSKSKVAEARHMLREINHVKQNETWIDGPSAQVPAAPPVAGYGFMDNHKKSMIRQWVENQSSQLFPQSQARPPPPPPRRDDETEEVRVVPVISESIIRKLETDNQSEKSSEKSERRDAEEEDQDSGPSEVPPALPLIDPLGSREISHESLARICSRRVSRESLLPTAEMMDCGLQVTEDDIMRAMGMDHPLAALSNCDMSLASSFHHGDAFSECALGDAAKRQFDQLARLRELFTSQLEMAEVTPSFRLTDAGSIYSEPPYRYNAGPSSVCSEPAYRPPSPRCRDCHQSLSRTPSQSSLPSLNGIVAIACMEQYASLRHPDGASDPNLQKIESRIDETLSKHIIENPLAELSEKLAIQPPCPSPAAKHMLPLLPITTTTTSPETYDSEHDSTPRTSKHSEISRRAESGYHSVATVRDSDESSFSSGACAMRGAQQQQQQQHPLPPPPPPIQIKSPKRRHKQDKSLCHWLRNPFTCTNPETEGEVSDF